MREWEIGLPDEEAVQTLEKAGYPSILAKVLAARISTNTKDIEAFLHCTGSIGDPFRMKDMPQAVARIRQAMKKGETVAVYGDYDVDGITASALLTSYLRTKDMDVMAYLPDREAEGYGLNSAALTRLRRIGVTLCITVDTGISAEKEAEAAKKKGLDLVITDHHEPRETLPCACAIVDPKRRDCPYPFKGLAGVGVAFQLVCALEGVEKTKALLAQYGDLLCLGTVADVVPLLGENRVFAGLGLQIMEKNTRVGIAALLKAAGVNNRALDATLLAFTAAPRINAVGRMKNAMPALELMLTRSKARAELLARYLCTCNDARKREEERILEEALPLIERQNLLQNRVLVVAGDDWADGVIGIVASRLANRFSRPTIIISFQSDGIGRASCRSFEGFPMHLFLRACSGLLERFGGHAMAAGFSIRKEKVSAFCVAAEIFAADCTIRPLLQIDSQISKEELTLDSAEACAVLEPCGEGNPVPLFYLEEVLIQDTHTLSGGKHLRLSCMVDGYAFEAIFFGVDNLELSIVPGDVLDMAISLSVNEWRGTRKLSVLVRDVRESAMFKRERIHYERTLRGEEEAYRPPRSTFASVWRLLKQFDGGRFSPRHGYGALKRRIPQMRYTQFLLILAIFRETGLANFSLEEEVYVVRLTAGLKVNLEESSLMQKLLPPIKEYK